MSTLLSIGRDRRLWLLGLVVILALAIGFFSLTPSQSLTWVTRAGYWVMLSVFVLFVRASWRVACRAWQESGGKRVNYRALCLIAVAGSVLLAHERYGLKILADELLLLGTSMGIHYERQVAYPVRATDVQGPFLLLQRVLDKRPFFFPFLVSLAHDFTGYRPENPFYVNTVLGFVFLGLVYVLGWRIGGTQWAGALGVVLFAGLPLISQQMKGGGFELLNLVMIAAVLLLAIRYAECRDETTLEALCFGAILLALTRYESVIFLVPVALLVSWGWWREKKAILTWPVIFSPLCLTVYLLQNKVFSVNTGAWELASRPEATTPFGLHYLPGNLGHALAFFFDRSGDQPNSPVFAALGLCALPIFGLWSVRVFRAGLQAEPWRIAVAIIGSGLFGVGALLMVYFWGQFDDPLIHRLSLPVHLLMLVAIVAAGRELLRSVRGWHALSFVALAGLVAYSLPVMSRRAYAQIYSPAIEMEWRQEFLKRYPDRDYLFIDNDAVFWIAHEISATPTRQARERKPGLIYHLRNHSFSAMYVFQRYRVDPENGQAKLDSAYDLGPDFELETVWERRIQTLLIGRISRITAIRENGEVAARATAILPIVPSDSPKTDAELEKAKKEFVENWVKQLP